MTPDLAHIADLQLDVRVQLGDTLTLTVGDVLALRPGSTVMFGPCRPMSATLLTGSQQLAAGDIVAVDEHYGLRVAAPAGPERG